MTDPIFRLNAAVQGRYTIERELGEGGMATVYGAEGAGGGFMNASGYWLLGASNMAGATVPPRDPRGNWNAH